MCSMPLCFILKSNTQLEIGSGNSVVQNINLLKLYLFLQNNVLCPLITFCFQYKQSVHASQHQSVNPD